jgi:ribose transport system permease protein
MSKKIGIGKKIVGTFTLPVLMFLVMMVLCYSNGKMYFGTWNMWRTLVVNIAISTTCALGIGLQFNNGRFDFSGGAIMLLTAIISGNIAKQMNNNLVLFAVLCIVICTILSVLVALLYVYGRLPVAITTITMALIFEAITPLIYDGKGIKLIANMELRKLSTYPGVLIPFVIAIVIYQFYKKFTLTGKQSQLLVKNQKAAVDIGISEAFNVILSYVFSGMIFGFATIIWTSVSIKEASFTSLSTVGDLFTNILPVFIGLALSKYCGEALGTVMGALTLSLMSYGLQAVLSAELGSAVSIVFEGLFILVFNIITTPYGSVIQEWWSRHRRKQNLQKVI